jgi:hypothetical protein
MTYVSAAKRHERRTVWAPDRETSQNQYLTGQVRPQVLLRANGFAYDLLMRHICECPRCESASRGITGKEAANLYGLSTSGFYKERRAGRIPDPTLPGKRYDRMLLEREMNKLSGIVEYESNPLDDWRGRYGSN